MKPRLVLGLGNGLAGDDGVGLRVAQRLSEHPELPDDVEVRTAGSDLLRAQDALRRRAHVILVDAVLGPEEPGTVLELDPADPDLGRQSASAHQLSPTASLALLRSVDPALRAVPITLIGVVIADANVRTYLSPELASRVDEIADRVLDALTASPTATNTRGADA